MSHQDISKTEIEVRWINHILCEPLMCSQWAIHFSQHFLRWSFRCFVCLKYTLNML